MLDNDSVTWNCPRIDAIVSFINRLSNGVTKSSFISDIEPLSQSLGVDFITYRSGSVSFSINRMQFTVTGNDILVEVNGNTSFTGNVSHVLNRVALHLLSNELL